MSNEDRLNALLEQWEELTQRGQPADPGVLCRDCPDLLPELTRQIEALRKMDALFEKAASGATRELGESAETATLDWSGIDTGRYELVRLHSAGGLGQIFVAHDSELKRDVALKLIKDESWPSAGNRRRFELEAEITGRLEHPGVVPVYGFGYGKEGRPYYAMRLIRGERLEDAIRRFHGKQEEGKRGKGDEGTNPESAIRDPQLFSTPEFRELLGRFIDLCQTVAYAHSRGVIHRDLKPANVMLGKYGETLVVDWGLAKALDGVEPDAGQSEGLLKPSAAEALSQSLMGFAKGTTAYMSPEQAEGRWDIVAAASDVYSLGAILYTLLTGRRAFEGEAPWEVIDQVRAGKFLPPRQVNARVPAPLEAIALKAMQHEPQDRYQGAQELATDIERWLAGEAVGAWHEPWPMRARRWLWRHRAVRSAVAAAIAIWLLSLTAATIYLGATNAALRAETDRAAASVGAALELIDGLDQATFEQDEVERLRGSLELHRARLAQIHGEETNARNEPLRRGLHAKP
ncbi:MAG TPA: serine/threonine-protein kinase [Pirellulales bacterium]|jgi:serine/threonine-protein kinase|nr:serine/threonine-protein kinase [Pirellulales bacterium]